MNREVIRSVIPFRLFNAQQEKWREAFLKVSWMLAEANWLYKLLVLSANQTEEKVKAENDASLWLRFLVLTTLCSKSHEGWLILSGEKDKNVHEVIEELLKSTDDSEKKQKLLEMQESLKEQLGNDKGIALIRNNIGFHYQYKKLNFPPLPIQENSPILSMLFTPETYSGPETHSGDILPLISLYPLDQAIIDLWPRQKSDETMQNDDDGKISKTPETGEWKEKFSEVLNELSCVQTKYNDYLKDIFLLFIEDLCKKYNPIENFLSSETVQNPPSHKNQKIYFFMEPPSQDEMQYYQSEITQ
ncbi:hypothetical protein [Candidatus Methylacidiphilum infernorum]|nr:hypothetical protein [Candidatus Methylacidiphilum infernorum]